MATKTLSLTLPSFLAALLSIDPGAPPETSSIAPEVLRTFDPCEEQCQPNPEISLPSNCDLAAELVVVPMVTLAYGNTGCSCNGEVCVVASTNEVQEQCFGLLEVFVDVAPGSGVHSYCLDPDPGGPPHGTAYTTPQTVPAPVFTMVHPQQPYPCNRQSPPLRIRANCDPDCEIEISLWCTSCDVGLLDCATRGG